MESGVSQVNVSQSPQGQRQLSPAPSPELARTNDPLGSDYVLETEALRKDFRGFTAVCDVAIRVRRGAVHALIGPNGAGKTTVFNLLTKFLKPTSGRILHNGIDITASRPAEIARSGIIRSFQISAVFPHLTVLENVRVSLQRRAGLYTQFWKSSRCLDELDPRALQLLDAVGLSGLSGHITGALSYGQKRTLELAMTLALEPEILLLDEPTQGMGHEDVKRIVALIKEVSVGRTILMVEHNLKVVENLSHRITVLARGSVLAEGCYEDVSKDPRVLEAYVGVTQDD